MNKTDIEHKIKKYKHKLKNSTRSDKAQIYQKKLKEYHNMKKGKNMSGGDNQLDQLKAKLELQKKTLENQLNTPSINKQAAQTINSKLDQLSDKYQEINHNLQNTSEKTKQFKTALKSALETESQQKKVLQTQNKLYSDYSDEIGKLLQHTSADQSKNIGDLQSKLKGLSDQLKQMETNSDFLANIFK